LFSNFNKEPVVLPGELVNLGSSSISSLKPTFCVVLPGEMVYLGSSISSLKPTFFGSTESGSFSLNPTFLMTLKP